jgi:hypothetical protein
MVIISRMLTRGSLLLYFQRQTEIEKLGFCPSRQGFCPDIRKTVLTMARSLQGRWWRISFSQGGMLPEQRGALVSDSRLGVGFISARLRPLNGLLIQVSPVQRTSLQKKGYQSLSYSFFQINFLTNHNSI